MLGARRVATASYAGHGRDSGDESSTTSAALLALRANLVLARCTGVHRHTECVFSDGSETYVKGKTMRQAELTLLYDGACPICAWEKRKLARSDRRGRLGFVNIQTPEFEPGVYGVPMQDLMGRLHAVTADGRLIKGAETLLRSYRAVGWWWIYLPMTIIPRPLVERAYGWFADHRHLLSKRIGWLFGPACKEGNCRKNE